LEALLDATWERELRRHPTWASRLGDRRWNDKWEDLSLEAIHRDHLQDVEALEKLKRIRRESLSVEHKLNHDLFRRIYSEKIEEYEHQWHLLSVNHFTPSVVNSAILAEALAFETRKDYEDWIARIHAIPLLVDQSLRLLREGIRTGRVLPKPIVERALRQVEHYATAGPDESPFFAPLTRFPSSLSASEQEHLRGLAREAIAGKAVPAFARLKEFLANQYLPAAPQEIGLWALPGGDKAYRFFARKHSTGQLSPQELHELGLREVARIHGAMQESLDRVKFTGNLREYAHWLRTDRRFFRTTSEELLEMYRAAAKRIEPRLVAYFRFLPRMPFGVEPIPKSVAADASAAYYEPPSADGSRAGTVFVNVDDPQRRPTWLIPALLLHEAVPGHHLQIALAMELRGLPAFRREATEGFDAYVEGWGLYAEWLGQEAGVYRDPYEEYGRLSLELVRAARLVVDTGIHFKRWDRQRALRYFVENTDLDEHKALNEIDRYAVMPGQALAYKVGELKFRELRERAAQEMKAQFDLRAFHEVLLGAGPLPLDLVEERVRAWIANAKRTDLSTSWQKKPDFARTRLQR
jgi:uncharacterized protein (DUF885 family)